MTFTKSTMPKASPQQAKKRYMEVEKGAGGDE
jgi:hypothetical protein